MNCIREWPLILEVYSQTYIEYPCCSTQAQVLAIETRWERQKIPRGRTFEQVDTPYPVAIIRDTGEPGWNHGGPHKRLFIAMSPPSGRVPALIPEGAGRYIGSSPWRTGERAYFFAELQPAPPSHQGGCSESPTPSGPHPSAPRRAPENDDLTPLGRDPLPSQAGLLGGGQSPPRRPR